MKVEAIPRPQVLITLEYWEAVDLQQFLRQCHQHELTDFHFKTLNITDLARQIEKVT